MTPGLPLGTEGPAMTPSSVDFPFFFLKQVFLLETGVIKHCKVTAALWLSDTAASKLLLDAYMHTRTRGGVSTLR